MDSGTDTGIPEGMSTEEYFRRNPLEQRRDKRKISVGFIKPNKLESNIIYVNLKFRSRPIVTYSTLPLITLLEADVVSKEKFNYYHVYTDDKKIESTAHTELGQIHVDNINWEYQCKNVLEELVKLNNGVVDYSRMIYEGAKAYKTIEGICDNVSRVMGEDFIHSLR